MNSTFFEIDDSIFDFTKYPCFPFEFYVNFEEIRNAPNDVSPDLIDNKELQDKIMRELIEINEKELNKIIFQDMYKASYSYKVNENPIWMKNDKSTYIMALSCIPNVQIKNLYLFLMKQNNITSKIDFKSETFRELNLRTRQIFFSKRWKHKICSCCQIKDGFFKECSTCHVVFYCSQTCMIKDRPEHWKECSNPIIKEENIRPQSKICVEYEDPLTKKRIQNLI